MKTLDKPTDFKQKRHIFY